MPTLNEIISIFRDDLNMQVTDNYAKVNAYISAASNDKAKIADGPDGQKAEAANEWFTRTTPLRKQAEFDNHLAVVRRVCEDEVRETVRSVTSTGGKLDASWVDAQIHNVSMRLNMEAALAAEIVNKVVNEAPDVLQLEPPAEATNERAIFDPARGVLLTWTNPNPDKLWRAVEIQRFDQQQPLASARISSFTDESAREGSAYRYRLTIIGSDGTRSNEVTIEAICIGEAADLEVIYNAAKEELSLSWQVPPAATVVILYRADGNAVPDVRVSQGDLVVTSGKQLRVGNFNTFVDRDVRPGHEYTYSVFLGFGSGRFSPKGVSTSVFIPSRPSPVENVESSYDVSPISVGVNWHNPNAASQWEEIRIRRKSADGQLIDVASGRLSECKDFNVTPGERYIYSIEVVGKQSLTSPVRTIDVVCACSVTGFGGIHRADHGDVSLNWQMPKAAALVHLFRRDGRAAPTWKRNGNDLIAVAGVFKQKARSEFFIDRDIIPGQSYTYVAVADFEAGTFIASSPVTINVEAPPPPPVQAEAEFDTDSMVVKWRAPPNAIVRYCVVRKVGADAPVSMKDGIIVESGTNAEIVRDKNVTAGQWYAYSIFTMRGNLVSTLPASTTSKCALFTPIDIAADVIDNMVRIRWKAPDSAKIVVEGRDGAPPTRFTNAKRYLDPRDTYTESVPYGSKRGFRIACAYAGLDGKPYSSKSYQLAVSVDHPLGFITHFQATPDFDSRTITCDWSAHGIGTIRIYRLQKDHGLLAGSIVELAELAAILDAAPEPIASDAINWVDHSVSERCPWYCCFMFSDSGNRARVGPRQCVGLVEPIGDLSIVRKLDGLAINFNWPESVDRIEVEEVHIQNATLADGNAALQRRHATKHTSRAKGEEIRCTPTSVGEYEYAVTPFQKEFRGLTVTSRYMWTGAPRKIRVSWTPRSNGLSVSWAFEDSNLPPGFQFAGVQLLGNPYGVPLSAGEPGSRILAVLPWNGSSADPPAHLLLYSEIVRLLGASGSLDKAFFRAELIQPQADHGTVLLVQEGRSAVPLNLATKKYLGEDLHVRKYNASPKEFLCSKCWKYYPVSEMLYAKSDKLAPTSTDDKFFRPGIWSRRQPGEFKYCPKKHALGKFSGSVPNHLIGMLGPPDSGKTYYVAAILDALYDNIKNNMYAFLSCLDDYSLERTRQLLTRYLSGQRLPKNPAGVADHLRYLLTVGDHHWMGSGSRSQIFSIQDTGGENLTSEDNIRQNLPYLELCSGLILVVDPLQFPAIRARLQGTRFEQLLPQENPKCKTRDIIGRLRTILGVGRKGEVPLALAITKCDVLVDAGILDDTNIWGWSQDIQSTSYPWGLHEDVTGMFAAFMQRYDPGTYREAIDQFPIHAFFGVSATGSSKMLDVDTFAHIEPKHVLHPVWWLLALTDMIRTTHRA
ncbi:MAG: hypothetical protein JNL18_18610 [Planctomycetaceae bacterium]|nr:hypothetical protein [Planctomycetaceae bacterium]